MEIQHATDLEIAKHLASHAASPTGKSKEQSRVSKLLADRNSRMKKAHVVQPMGLVYKEDRDENMKQEIADRLANTPAERAERKHRVQVAINKAKQLREGNKMKTFSQLKEAAAPASPALVGAMNSLLADNFAFYLKAHNYHWNIEGADFAQYHEFLGNLYEDAHGAVDNIAERIRTLKAYALGTMENFMGETSITEDSSIPGPMQMLQNITMDNETLIESLTRAYKAAEVDGKVGLANFLQDRIDAHEKHGWMLRSLVKGNLSESTELDEVNSRHSFVAAQARLTPKAKNVKDALSNTNRAKAATNKYGRVIGKIAGMKPKEVVANLKDMGEETEQLDEVGPQKRATRLHNKLRDAVRGARYKQSGMPVFEPETQHKTPQAHNKAIGRALRAMSETAKQIDEMDKEMPLSREQRDNMAKQKPAEYAKLYNKVSPEMRKKLNLPAKLPESVEQVAEEDPLQARQEWMKAKSVSTKNPKADRARKVKRLMQTFPMKKEEVERVAEEDIRKSRVIHNGREIGEVGIDTDASPGNGKWYAKHHASKMNTSGHDSKKDAVEEVHAAHREMNETLKPSMGASAYIHDFVHSKNTKFAGKSKAMRTKMALGAYYGDKKGK